MTIKLKQKARLSVTSSMEDALESTETRIIEGQRVEVEIYKPDHKTFGSKHRTNHSRLWVQDIRTKDPQILPNAEQKTDAAARSYDKSTFKQETVQDPDGLIRKVGPRQMSTSKVSPNTIVDALLDPIKLQKLKG